MALRWWILTIFQDSTISINKKIYTHKTCAKIFMLYAFMYINDFSKERGNMV